MRDIYFVDTDQTYKCSVQYSSVPKPVGAIRGWGKMRDDSAEILFKTLLREATAAILAWAGMSTL